MSSKAKSISWDSPFNESFNYLAPEVDVMGLAFSPVGEPEAAPWWVTCAGVMSSTWPAAASTAGSAGFDARLWGITRTNTGSQLIIIMAHAWSCGSLVHPECNKRWVTFIILRSIIGDSQVNCEHAKLIQWLSHSQAHVNQRSLGAQVEVRQRSSRAQANLSHDHHALKQRSQRSSWA